MLVSVTDLKPFTTDLSASLVARFKKTAKRKGLLLMAAVAQAMELWLKEYGA